MAAVNDALSGAHEANH